MVNTVAYLQFWKSSFLVISCEADSSVDWRNCKKEVRFSNKTNDFIYLVDSHLKKLG